MIMRIPAALTITLISVAALLLQQAHAAPASVYAFGTTEELTQTHVVQQLDAASGTFSNPVPIRNGSWPNSLASTINTEAHIMYIHFGLLGKYGESMLYAIDLDSHKVIDAVNIGVWSIESMHYDKDNDCIIAYGSLDETDWEEHYILTFPTKNYTDVKIIADVTAWFGNTECTTALDSADQIMYFIYTVPSTGTSAKHIFSSVSLQHPDAGPKNISLVQFNTAEWRPIERAHYDPTTRTIMLLVNYKSPYYLAPIVVQLDASTGVSSSAVIDVRPDSSSFYPYQLSAYDEATHTFYTAGSTLGYAAEDYLVTMDFAKNHNQTHYTIQKTGGYFHMKLIEAL